MLVIKNDRSKHIPIFYLFHLLHKMATVMLH